MRFSIFTLFPDYFQSGLASSLLGRAQAAGLLSFDFINFREFGEGKYRAVDDKPYGGGVGMVLMPTVLERALEKLLGGPEALNQLEADVQTYRAAAQEQAAITPASAGQTTPHVVYLSPQGRRLDSRSCRRLAQLSHVVLICGHYEGIDERAIETFVHEEISIGDYILTGGEPAAAVVIDAVSRFVPGVVGDKASVDSDTFEGHGEASEMLPGGLKYPLYTRPALWRGKAIPEILVSGHHGEIARWRRQKSKERTAERRPDLVPPEKPEAPVRRKKSPK